MKLQTIKSKGKKWLPPLTAFVFPILICCIGFALMGVYPFGTRSALVIDGVYQYLGFYEEFLHQLEKGLKWTFSEHAMGYNFFGLFSYYLSSPFNILALLLRQIIYINEAVTIVVLLKIGLTGVSMYWYIKKKMPGKEKIALCAGCMYALSNYILGYYSNLMWLDCVMLLPVLVWAIEVMIQEGRWKWYTLILAYCILSNYYMGFIVCVFSLLYFLASYWALEKRADKWSKAGGKFIGASLLSVGIAAVLLFPSIFAVGKTIAAKEAGLFSLNTKYGQIWEQLGRTLFDAYPWTTSGDQASVNLYCGCAAVLFLILYFLNQKIPWREKTAAGVLLVFYFAGFHFSVLNLLLHGLHKPVGMPNRFAFVFIFLFLSAACEGWEKAGKLGKRRLAAGIGAAVVFCGIVGIMTENFKVLGSVGLMLLYFSLLAEVTGFYGESQKARKWQRMICLLILCEIGVHGVLSICNNGSANRNLYQDSGEELKQMISAKKDKDEYRTDIYNPILRNEELLFGLNGISMFSSANTSDMQRWMESMGFETGKNRFQYAGSTEIMDMLLGIKYLACRKDMQLDTAYKKTDEGTYFDLYTNNRALKDGYLVDNKVKNFRIEGNNPFEIQNNLLTRMGCGSLYQTEYVPYLYGESEGEAKTVFEVYLQGGEHGYLWIDGMEPSQVTIDGELHKGDNWNNKFLDLGYSNERTFVYLRLRCCNRRLLALLLPGASGGTGQCGRPY
ncbi:MAG: YfhO family protein [Ruminococcus sp.]|jgi:uncharacterized membrane protein YfhO